MKRSKFTDEQILKIAREGEAGRKVAEKRLTRGDRVPLPTPSQRRERWSMDFTLDTLADGLAFRTLNIVDDFTRQCVAIEVDRSLPGAPCRERLGSPARGRRPAADDRGRQWARICGTDARCVGL